MTVAVRGAFEENSGLRKPFITCWEIKARQALERLKIKDTLMDRINGIIRNACYQECLQKNRAHEETRIFRAGMIWPISWMWPACMD